MAGDLGVVYHSASLSLNLATHPFCSTAFREAHLASTQLLYEMLNN